MSTDIEQFLVFYELFQALILNTIFIYDGMNSGWYEDPEGEGNGMKVVSIGEGIIAGGLT